VNQLNEQLFIQKVYVLYSLVLKQASSCPCQFNFPNHLVCAHLKLDFSKAIKLRVLILIIRERDERENANSAELLECFDAAQGEIHGQGITNYGVLKYRDQHQVLYFLRKDHHLTVLAYG